MPQVLSLSSCFLHIFLSVRWLLLLFLFFSFLFSVSTVLFFVFFWKLKGVIIAGKWSKINEGALHTFPFLASRLPSFFFFLMTAELLLAAACLAFFLIVPFSARARAPLRFLLLKA